MFVIEPTTQSAIFTCDAAATGCNGGLAYLPTTERPYNYMYEPPTGTAQQNCEYRESPVWIKTHGR